MTADRKGTGFRETLPSKTVGLPPRSATVCPAGGMAHLCRVTFLSRTVCPDYAGLL